MPLAFSISNSMVYGHTLLVSLAFALKILILSLKRSRSVEKSQSGTLLEAFTEMNDPLTCTFFLFFILMPVF